jgi:hypothetical protein
MNNLALSCLGGLSAIVTALAAGSVTDALKVIVKEPSAQGVITALLVIMLGVTTAALNAIDPKGRRDSALSAGRRLNALRDQLRLIRIDDDFWSGDKQEIRQRISSMQERYGEIEREMPTISDGAHRRGKASLRSNVSFRDLRALTGRSPS